MKVVSIVGARPQFVKLAPINASMKVFDVNHVVIDTGQHYDAALSADLLADFAVESPKYDLGIGSGSHAQQTAAMLSGVEGVLQLERPDWVLVYGDTNSTLAGALASVKQGIPTAHLEAGLRSYNRHMPEEINRVVTDHACDLLLAPTERAVNNLEDEGLRSRSRLVGDVMMDICLRVADRLREVGCAKPPSTPGEYVLATLHRPYNTDDAERLAEILDALAALPLPVFLPVHPRLRVKAHEAGIDLRQGALRPVKPMVYSDLICTAMNARAIATDSGGLQKEAYTLGIPCTTIRSETEWVETLQGGWNVLVFDTNSLQRLSESVLRERPQSDRPMVYGRGDAAGKVVALLESELGR